MSMNEWEVTELILKPLEKMIRKTVRDELNKERAYQLYGEGGGRVDTFQP